MMLLYEKKMVICKTDDWTKKSQCKPLQSGEKIKFSQLKFIIVFFLHEGQLFESHTVLTWPGIVSQVSYYYWCQVTVVEIDRWQSLLMHNSIQPHEKLLDSYLFCKL